VQPEYLFDLVHRKPRLGHQFAPCAKGAKGGGVKGLRRDAPSRGLSRYRPRAGEGGRRYEIMADSVPIRPSKCPPCHRNTVRHAVGTVSAIGSESCPSWAGTRTERTRAEARYEGCDRGVR